MIIYASSFLAVPLPNEFQPEFRQVLLKLKSFDLGLKTVQPATPHITVYFLGQQSDEQLGNVANKIKPLLPGISEVKLRVSGLWNFGQISPKVLYLNVARPRQFDLFADAAAHALQDDHPTEKRHFKPHLTLARLPNKEVRDAYLTDRDKIKHELGDIAWEFLIKELVLYGSTDPEGARCHHRIITLAVP